MRLLSMVGVHKHQRDQLESFLWRAVKVGFHRNPTLSAICETVNDQLDIIPLEGCQAAASTETPALSAICARQWTKWLCRRITTNPCHPAPSTSATKKCSFIRSAPFPPIPASWTNVDSLVACNYMIRMLYK